MDLRAAQLEFHTLLDKLNPTEVAPFLQWISNSFDTKLEETENGAAEAMVTMHEIIGDLRNKVPINGLLPSEQPLHPEVGIDSDCDPSSTVHVDAFLYDDDDIDCLVDEGRLSRHYCRACGSQVNAPLTFISHSLSLVQLRYLFTSLLPSDQLVGKSLVDVGSRLGAVLYAAYVYSPGLSSIVGVEMNAELCALQSEIVNNHGISDKVRVICDDIRNQPQAISTADLIVLNNVFQFFLPATEQVLCWKTLKQHLKSGSIVVTSPTVVQLTEHLTLDFDVNAWLLPLDSATTAAKFAGANEELFAECSKLHIYRVN